MKSTIQFAPVTMGRASEEVALQIEAAILDGKIEPGDRLPSERELQLHFNTSRGVIREALQALKQKSLIEIKKGAKGGAYVREVEVSTAGESLALFIKRQPLDPQHLIEFRESLDRTITLLAISRGAEEEKIELLAKAKILETMLRQSDPDMVVLAELDRELNIMLARMTHNPIFEWIMQALQLGFSSSDVTLYQGEQYRKETGENWKNTAQAIADNEPLRALSHISYHYAMLLKLLDAVESTTDGNQKGLTGKRKD
ncbi:FadR/GntR family transcriptional regulator [Desulfobulbus alkaliphilus]|uniref:FadR/GntR family transcriptional regulator n=1 Tax=Desulfobulbus alkaliphilus TaxID=869814 RepID=UPI0019663EEB|nr:GntR family transcriptional regulator [Desulfobulbus alkaliphilus]MBM9537462.1 FadR family transcriptional regulator [Desulfobulbus alkaliphilus]